MEVKIKRLSKSAVIPKYAHQTDAGLDLTAVSKWEDEFGNVCYGTGLAFEIPEGYVGLIYPRSSNYKQSLLMSNAVGVIDSGYRGEVVMKYRKDYQMQRGCENQMVHLSEGEYEIGERMAQMIIMPYPKIEFVEVEELSDGERGVHGYGSTGK